MTSSAESDQLVTHLFRHSWGRMIATLTRQFGLGSLEVIEDAAQEAFLAAFRHWPTRGVPDNPSAWLFKVAQNKVLDYLRSVRQAPTTSGQIESVASGIATNASFRGEVEDDLLRMMLLCCDPELGIDSQVALTLHTVCGFSYPEIASAFLTKEETISKRVYRARETLRASELLDRELTSKMIGQRLDSLLKIIYLLFNEGYSSHASENLVRYELCAEALRLARLISDHKGIATAEAMALAALLCFHAARLPARVNSRNELMLLAEQDRSLWDKGLISEGMSRLEAAMKGDVVSQYHFEAGIASCHAAAATIEGTDWKQVMFYYNQLMEVYPSEIVRLNKSVVTAMIKGVDEALSELQQESTIELLTAYYLYHATVADFYRRKGDYAAAAESYQLALDRTSNSVEREFLLRRLRECEM